MTEASALTAHQVVAHHFRIARLQAGWTQVETSRQLEPFLGYHLNQAGVSAIEKTFDSPRRRNIDVAELIAFSHCFNKPVEWFLGLPESGTNPGQYNEEPAGRMQPTGTCEALRHRLIEQVGSNCEKFFVGANDRLHIAPPTLFPVRERA